MTAYIDVMAEHKDITGTRSGRLVVDFLHTRGAGRLLWACRCDCGGSKVLPTNALIGKRKTLSCGCLQREAASQTRTTHGLTGTYLYRTWSQIIQRCTNPNNPAFQNYGGRGIKIDPVWRESFLAFKDAIGDRPSSAHSLDRVDNSGDYVPGNLRWASRTEQARNRRSNRLITANGVTRTLAEWIELSGMQPTTIERRLKRGWPPHEAVTAKSRKA